MKIKRGSNQKWLWCILSIFYNSILVGQTLDPALNKALVNAQQGTIVELPGFLSEHGIANLNYQKMILPGPQFIISDDPEYIRFPEGVALKEPVQPGTVRVYVYNVNGIKEPAKMDRRITAVIKNTGKTAMHIRMLKYSSQKPSGNYFQMAKQGMADFLASQPEEKTRKVEPGMSMAIDDKMEKYIVKYDELAHGIYEFVTDQPGEINIIQTDLNTSGPKALARIKGVLPTRGTNAGRGIFGVSNYGIATPEVLDTKNGAVQIIVADGVRDPWITGMDHSLNKVSKLEGNYGVLYHIELKWKSSDGKGLALVMWNSRGSKTICNGMAATVAVSEGKFKEGIVQLPSDKLITRYGPESMLIQVFPPAINGKEQTIKVIYSPPGASCLPTPLVFIPVSME